MEFLRKLFQQKMESRFVPVSSVALEGKPIGTSQTEEVDLDKAREVILFKVADMAVQNLHRKADVEDRFCNESITSWNEKHLDDLRHFLGTSTGCALVLEYIDATDERKSDMMNRILTEAQAMLKQYEQDRKFQELRKAA